MLPAWFLIALVLTYVSGLFLLAYLGDRGAPDPEGTRRRAVVYSLCLAVYCTSWTFFGAVGSAAREGWSFLPIYLGPILMMVLGWDLLRRLATISRRRNITSIADFIATRYGRSRPLAVLVTVIAVTGAVPYIALQLKAVTDGLTAASTLGSGTAERGLAAGIALAMALFAIAFGTRRLDAEEHHQGLLWALALESLVKVLAFIVVGIFAISLAGGFTGVADAVMGQGRYAKLFAPAPLPGGFLVMTLLAGMAILCLPRQFYVTAVEYRHPRDLKLARWLFPAYLGLFSMLVVPIAVAGLDLLPADANADLFVLLLPAQQGSEWILTLAFLGGFSAATGMVIAASVAVATMVSNDLVLPLLLRWRRTGGQNRDWSGAIILCRRVVIIAIAAISYGYFRLTDASQALAAIGLLSFAAAAQFAPGLILGIYWPRATTGGALAGLAAGFSLWLYTLFVPAITGLRWGQGTWLDPQALFSLPLGTPLEHGVIWSLGLNVLLLVGVSLRRRPTLAQELEARTFTGGTEPPPRRPAMDADRAELRRLAARFVGDKNAHVAFERYAQSSEAAMPNLAQFTENLLAGAIGAASARSVMNRALAAGGLSRDRAETLLADTSQAIRFNRRLLRSTLDHLPQGVSVVDRDLRLSGWNEAYMRMFDYPEGLVHVGCDIAELIRFNAQRGYLQGDLEAEIEKRLDGLRSGRSYQAERYWPDGRVIETQGKPMPDGGYITTFTDITRRKRTEQALEEAKLTLEQRVIKRTEELTRAMREVERARAEAEQANQAKTRFFAAASHDLLQPLNAARLFTSVLLEKKQELPQESTDLVAQLSASLDAAEGLLSSLLDVARLERGALVPDPQPVSLAALFKKLEEQFAPLAARHGLKLRIRPTDYWVHSDPQMLQRMLQNFLGNALRYTESGGVLLGVRHAGAQLRVSVWDTGPGISADAQRSIFQEFKRLHDPARGQPGLGLGLSIAQRMASMLGHAIDLDSRPGHGSCFSLVLRRAEAVAAPQVTRQSPAAEQKTDGLTVLCIDNEPSILAGMQQLLTGWGCRALLAEDSSSALRLAQDTPPDVVLADYHLNHRETGLKLIEHLRRILSPEVLYVVISADHSQELKARLERAGLTLLRKPIKPAKLRAMLTLHRNLPDAAQA